ncbi:hypothetical protein CAMRE0001_2690 [Campylobacter rectus RM3267]|uniref:Uncharacterized protein n=1 Tax=Campylobacter rectus RM3267 TaxID=553218 RepID=B9D3Z6_CAMRE|nr:hypothetical protein CAMRE0001_2690 [Campylobacter rectus RM3267]
MPRLMRSSKFGRFAKADALKFLQLLRQILYSAKTPSNF